MTSISDLIQQREELASQQAALEQSIRELQQAERVAVLANIRSLMAQYGLTAADLSLTTTRKTRGPNKATTEGHVGKTVAAKYRNAATGDSWSGRGLKPKWLTAQLEQGKKLDDFLIPVA